MSMPGRILIVKLSSLGDIVHALPAACSLRATYPQAKIAWAVERRWLPLVASRAAWDEVFPVDTLRLRGDPRTWPDFLGEMRALRAFAPEVALDLQGTFKSALVARCSGAPRRLGFAAPALREPGAGFLYTQRVAPQSVHIVDQMMDLAAGLGPLQRVRQFPFPIPDDVAAGVQRWLEDNRVGPFVFLSPGGGWASKRWPTERYASLAEVLLRDHGLASVLNRGPGEQAMDDAFRRASAIRARIFSGDTLHLAAMLRQARLVVGGDTGPLHLAAALGTPVVALFGPTDPRRNGPYSSLAIVLRKEDRVSYARSRRYSPAMLALTVEEVAAACAEVLRLPALGTTSA